MTKDNEPKPLTIGDIVKFREKMYEGGCVDIDDFVITHGGSNLLNPIQYLGENRIQVDADFLEYPESPAAKAYFLASADARKATIINKTNKGGTNL